MVVWNKNMSSSVSRVGARKTLTFSTATLRDQKTLIWLREQSPAVHWWRWDGVVTSLEDYHRWSAQGASVVGVVPVEEVKCLEGAETETEKRDAWLDRLYSVAKRVLYVMLPRCCLVWKSEEFWRDNFDNLLILEDLSDTYPFLKEEWKGTAEDAVCMLALVARYHRLVRSGKGQGQGQRPLYDMVVEEDIRPAPFVLYTQYYTPKDKKRAKEIRECLRRNVKCRWVDRIILLTERDESVAWASFTSKDKEKIQQRVIGQRLRYSDFFKEVCRRYAEDGQDAVVALANADMYMGEELAEVWRIRWADRAVCLLRWDDLGEGPEKARLFGPRSDSQDVWMFSARSIAERHWGETDTDIPLGVPGCDNAILHSLLQRRFLLSNPALSLKTYHLHNSGVRSYTKADTIHRPIYLHLEPTYLVDTKQEFVPRESPYHICNEVVSFTVKSASLSDEITYCTMLEKAGRYRWEPMVENYAFEPAIPVYTWRGGAGVTPNGMVYDLYRIYTGRSALQQPEYNYWKKAGVDIFTPMLSCPRMVAIPLPDGTVFRSWPAYVAYYLSRYLRLREERKEKALCYWLPNAFREPCVREFPSVDISLGMSWAEGRAIWAEEVVGFLPGPVGGEVGREEIQALRRAWREEGYPTDKKHCVVWQGGAFTSEWIEALATRLLEKGWSVSVVRSAEEAGKMAGASVFLWDCSSENTGDAGQSLWRLPKGARVVEGQGEMEIQGEGQHMAHMADLESRVLLFRRGSVQDRQEEWEAHLRMLEWFE